MRNMNLTLTLVVFALSGCLPEVYPTSDGVVFEGNDTGEEADTLDTGEEADTLDTGEEADTLDTGEEADTVDTGEEADTVDTGESSSCEGWTTTLTFDESDTSEEFEKTITATVVYDSGTSEEIEISLSGLYEIFYDDDCFGIPADGDQKLCVRGYQDDETSEYDAGQLTLGLPEGFEVNIVGLTACDVRQSELEVTPFVGDPDDGGAASGATALFSTTGNDTCGSSESAAWTEAEAGDTLRFDVQNWEWRQEAWALADLTLSFVCDEE